MAMEKVIATKEIASPRPSVGARDNANGKLTWQRNPAIQRLLDVIVSIIAEEFIEIAKKNSGVFTNGGKKCE